MSPTALRPGLWVLLLASASCAGGGSTRTAASRDADCLAERTAHSEQTARRDSAERPCRAREDPFSPQAVRERWRREQEERDRAARRNAFINRSTWR